ncbi:U-box domain-containing protein 44 [Selaginella moellendorffii]|nr:U-box domain-containing protein 44 [Selaginella moellendorffii]|eukprot:XP_002963754.2 U-box domain-containing protein 44 [Selaginella moellendorffii]
MANPGVAVLLKELSAVIQDANAMVAKKESIKELISFLEGIKEVLDRELGDLRMGEGAARACAALTNSVRKAQGMVSRHKRKRRLYMIVWLRVLNREVEEVVRGLENSLAQLQDASSSLSENSRSKLDNLISRMKQTTYEVPNPEEDETRKLLDLDVDSLIVKFSKDLGINFERDRELLSRELRYFKADISTEDKDELETMVEELLSTLACENSALLQTDDEAIPSFDAFECPLTKQVMKDPVVLESEHTYERHAIEEWFRTCREQHKEPTCPVSGRVLSTTELHSNLVLRKTIEEWYQRNVASRMQSVVDRLTAVELMQDVDGALDEILRLFNENPMNKWKIKSANLIPKIAKIWSLEGAAYFRSKALEVLDRMAVDDADNQHIIVKEGFLRFSVRSLGSKEDEEKANAARLLYHLSTSSLEVCEVLGTEKGAVIHLAGLLASKDQDLSQLAEKTLRNLEQVESNVLEMAEAGRIQPLLARLCEGPQETRIKMASYLAKRHLVKSQVKLVAQSATRSLIAMLPGTLEAKEASLGVFLMLSSLADNKSLLIEAGILPPLLDIMFSIHSSVNNRALKLKECAAEVVSKLVSSRGSWENASIDAEGTPLHSEFVVHNLLGLMAHARPDWKHTLLQILTGMASSPDAGEEACEHIRSGHGVRICAVLLSETSVDSHRLHALRLLAVIAPRLGPDIVREFHGTEMAARLQALLRSTNTEERAAAAFVLGAIPMTEKEVSQHLDPELLEWTLTTLAGLKDSKRGRSHTRLLSETIEGLLGILLHFLRSNALSPPSTLRQHDVMTLLVNELDRQGEFVIKHRAAMGIKCLSNMAASLCRKPELPPTTCFCFRSRPGKLSCSIHPGVCDPADSVCMVEARAIVPVLELLEEEDQGVQLAAMEALSTLLADSSNLRGAVEELGRVEGLQKILELFYGLQKGELQDRTAWVVERIVRVDDLAKSLSVDTKLFKALVEAFKFGSATTKALAQDALTNLKQLSGVSAGVRRKK